MALRLVKIPLEAPVPDMLLRIGIAIVAAWVCALVAAAAGVPLLAVIVLALIVSAGVFRLMEKSEPPK
jgi:hypothetical protein